MVLADFGSTFTKVALVEQGSGVLLARAQAPTSIDTDVLEGYSLALDDAMSRVEAPVELVDKIAASSAGGGLRMAAVGLVPDLTAAAATQAALNAGAKVELTLAGMLVDEDVRALDRYAPEILLFSGGTDGGQRKQVLHNAEVIASGDLRCHVVVACNEDIASEVAKLITPLTRVDVVPNVLPDVDRLNIEPARAAIHEAFITHVIQGKGLSTATEFGDSVVMPTPEAVLRGASVLSKGDGRRRGLGNLVVVDIGGATTDVHSSVALRPTPVGVSSAGLPALPVTRTVQGDLGMRSSAWGVWDADKDWLTSEVSEVSHDESELSDSLSRRVGNPSYLPDSLVESALDRALAMSCTTQALKRHCGFVSTVYIPNQGVEFVQHGLDLRDVPLVVGTGGMLVHSEDGPQILRSAIDRRETDRLTPRAPEVAIDSEYILGTAGLLAERDLSAAFDLARSHLKGEEDAPRTNLLA